jgi:hypothetical protein
MVAKTALERAEAQQWAARVQVLENLLDEARPYITSESEEASKLLRRIDAALAKGGIHPICA